LPRSSRLLVAVSGGIDSVALLHGCCALAEPLANTIHVAHVDHGIRKESAEDAAFVRDLAVRLECPFYQKAVQPPGPGCNLEQWGRTVRYAFFCEVLDRAGLDVVLTAHTADDVAETFLMRILSNKELHGIARRDSRRRLVRPMLAVPREEVVAYAEAQGLSFREDQTNTDNRFLRNRVRNVLLPVLKREFDPRAVEVLAHRAAAAADDLECLRSCVKPALVQLRDFEFGSREWRRAARSRISKTRPELAWRIAESLFRDKLGFNLSRGHARQLAELLTAKRSRLELPCGVTILSKKGAIFIEKKGQNGRESLKSNGY
jgi:tRNA(Ile)-lysidine synthase